VADEHRGDRVDCLVSVESLILEAYKGGSDRYYLAEDDLVLDDDMQYSMCARAGEHFWCGLMVVHHELDLLVLAKRLPKVWIRWAERIVAIVHGILDRRRRRSPKCFSENQLEPGPYVRDGADLHVNEAHRKRDLADDILGDICWYLGRLLWPGDPDRCVRPQRGSQRRQALLKIRFADGNSPRMRAYSGGLPSARIRLPSLIPSFLLRGVPEYPGVARLFIRVPYLSTSA